MSSPSAAVGAARGRMPVDSRVVAVGLGVLLANAAIGLVVGDGKVSIGVAVAVLPLLVAVAVWIGMLHREILVFTAFALPLSGIPFSGRLPGTGGTAVYVSDLLVALAFVGWALAHLVAPPEVRPRWPRTAVLSWPFALLALTVLIGVVRGHAAWGTSYLSEPTRFLIYAGIAGAITALTPGAAYRGLVAVFYVGTLVETLLLVYYLASGTSQTGSASLSTGGTRALALSTAAYLAGAFVLALLNMERDRGGRRLALHLFIATLAAGDVILSLGRTTFVAIGVLVPVLLLALRHARRTVLAFLPLLLPVLALLTIGALQLYPSFGSTLTSRLTGGLSSDAAVVERQREYAASLQGFDRHVTFGFGFGRPISWVSIDGSIRTTTGGPENSYIWVLAGGGAVALTALLVLIGVFFVDAFRRLRGATGDARSLLLFAMSMAFILLVNTLTGPVLSDPQLLVTVWTVLLLPAAVPRSGAA